jgi:MYXO-CTERM domain-containing protein
MLARAAFVCILLGCFLLFGAYVGAKQSAVARDEPKVITCRELTESGFGDNAHVRMTDFHLGTANYVYEEKVQWTKAWVPAAPLGSALHQAMVRAGQVGADAVRLPGEDVRIIALLPKARNHEDVLKTARQEFIQGLLIKPVEITNRDKSRMLEEAYPGLDFDRCLILVEGRKPTSPQKTRATYAGGAGLLVLGAFLAWRSRRGEAN